MAGEDIISKMIVKITAQNEASAELSKVSKDLNQTAVAGKSTGETIGAVSSSFAKMGYTVHSAMSMMDRFEVSQLSMESASVQVGQAQRRYNEALVRYGADSSQAQSAAAGLTVAQNSLNSANIRANSSMIMIGLSALTMIPQFLAAGKAVVTFATTGRIAIAGLSLTLSTLAPYLVVIGVALGALYYWYSKNQEAAYSLRSEQAALADSTDLAASSFSNMFSYLTPLEAATGELATKQVALKAAFQAWMKALEEFGPDSPEAKAAEAAYRNLGKEVDALKEKLEGLNTEMEKETPAPDIKKVTDWKDALMGTFTSIGGGLDWLIQKIYEFGVYMVGNFTSTFGELLNITIGLWNSIVEAIMSPLNALWTWLFGGSIIPDIVSGFASAWESILGFTASTWESIKNAIMTPINAVWTWLDSTWASILGSATSTWASILGSATSTWESIKNAIMTPINAVWTWLDSTWNSITSTLGTVWNNIKTLASEKWNAIKDAIWGALPDWLQDMILGVYTWTWPELPDWSAAWTAMLNTIYGMLPSWFKVLLGLEAPPAPSYSDWSNYSDGGGGGWDDYQDTGGWVDYVDWGEQGPYSDAGFAAGGIVTKKITNATIGEAGPEAIIPLPGYLKNGGLGTNVTINIGNVYGVDDLEAAIQQAFENLKWQIRAAGG